MDVEEADNVGMISESLEEDNFTERSLSICLVTKGIKYFLHCDLFSIIYQYLKIVFSLLYLQHALIFYCVLSIRSHKHRDLISKGEKHSANYLAFYLVVT